MLLDDGLGRLDVDLIEVPEDTDEADEADDPDDKTDPGTDDRVLVLVDGDGADWSGDEVAANPR